MNEEATALAGHNDAASDRLDPSLPGQVQKHLGVLLAQVYAQEQAEPDPTTRFAELLAELDLAITGAQHQAEAEFHQLLVNTMPALRRFALSLTHRSVTADDLVQDTLLRAWKNRARFERGTNFEAWTFVILRNQFYTDHRKHREVQDSDGIHAERLVSLPSQGGRIDLQDVHTALAQLTPVMREALVLVALQGLSYEDAATIMGCELGTAKSRVSRARDQLARLVGYTGGEVGNDAVMLSAFGGPVRPSR